MKTCCCQSHNGFLTRAGYARVAQRGVDSLETVDMFEDMCYLDKVGSVSGLVEVEGSCVWDEQVLDSQYRRFINA